MMEQVLRIDGCGANAVDGQVIYDWTKLLWNMGMLSGAVVGIPLATDWGAVVLFILFTYFSLLIGHSVGMHRMMIHRTFRTPLWLEKVLIYIGVLVGMAGPYGVIRIHDVRDWAQRQYYCHDFFSHRRRLLRDLWWQLMCRFDFTAPPTVTIESRFADDPFYQWLEKTWRYHQLLLAVVLYLCGGWYFVVWGVFARVSVSVVGHWTITYFCHNPGPGSWRVNGAYVQASNIPGLGILTYGECWHNNHHAFPESARIGLEKGQSDPAWLFIVFLRRCGLAFDIGVPRSLEQREDLEHIHSVSVDNIKMALLPREVF